MELTDAHLKKIMPNAPKRVRDKWLPVCNQVCLDYGITTAHRVAAFLATIAVESGELRYSEELASGSAYEGRKDLGNTQRGDGRKFKGRGKIQLTGRSNAQAYTNYLKKSRHLPFVDFISEPKMLAQEPYATDSAAWFWQSKRLNAFADQGDFLATQTRVNGRNKKTGLPNHWKERSGYYARALSVLPHDFTLTKDSVVFQPPAPSVPPA